MGRLSSLRLTWWILLGIIAWFVLGIKAAALDSFQKGLEGMNEVLVREWLIQSAQEHPWTLAWFSVLLCLAAILSLNLIVCIWKRIIYKNSEDLRLRYWAFLVLHICFALTILLHGMETIIGKKYPQKQVQAGEAINLDSSWKVRVDKVNYSSNPKFLQLNKDKARRAMSRERFNMKTNWVRIDLLHNGHHVKKGEIKMLEPLSCHSLHVILRGFGYHPEGIKAKIKVVKSVLHIPFLSVYLLFIFSFFAWLLLNLTYKQNKA